MLSDDEWKLAKLWYGAEISWSFFSQRQQKNVSAYSKREAVYVVAI